MKWLAIAFALLLLGVVLAAGGQHLPISLLQLTNFPGGDKLAHFLLLGSLNLLICLAFARGEGAARRTLLLSALVGLAATLEEISQIWIPNRTFSLGDLSANLAGIFTFGLGVWIFRRRGAEAWDRTPRPGESPEGARPAAGGADRPDVDDVGRPPVWNALSELFLDTELDRQDLEYLARVLADSPYDVRRLEEILFAEVYPVCIWNLRSPAGEWGTFDSAWLERSIRERMSRWLRLPPRLQTGRWMVAEEWAELKGLVREIRGGGPPAR